MYVLPRVPHELERTLHPRADNLVPIQLLCDAITDELRRLLLMLPEGVLRD